MPRIHVGTSNQIVESTGKLYNVELWNANIQMSSSVWDEDRLMSISILKLYNQCTVTLSVLQGDLAIPAVTPGPIESVPGTLDSALEDGVIPRRFLPANLQADIDNGTPNAYFKAFGVQGVHAGTGFSHELTIQHWPDGHPNESDNGKIRITYNNSTSDFTHADAGLDSSNSFTYLTDSNINE